MAPQPNVNTSQTHEEIVSKYRTILKSNGVTDEVEDVIINHSGLVSEGMASQQLYATVVFKNPNLKNLNLFVKAHTSSSGHSEFLSELKAFEKEARFLTEYVPDARAFCKSKGQEVLLDIYPKCYYGDKEIIVQENLVLDKGYTLVDKEVLQTLEEAKFAVQTLAKHHVISRAMILNAGGAANFFAKYPNLEYESFGSSMMKDMMEPMMENGISTMIKVLEEHNVDGRDESIAFLKSHIGKTYDNMMGGLKFVDPEDPLLLLNHGDYWNNNMLFLKSKTGETIGHKAIDLQVTRYNSAMADLTYYFYLSVQPNVRRNHLRDILGVYLETLKKISNDLGAPIELTFEDLFLLYRKKLNYGYWFGSCNAGGFATAVIKDLDVSQLEDMRDFGKAISKLIQKWMEENPEKGVGWAEEIVKVVREYKELAL